MKKENIVLPLEKVVKAVENKKITKKNKFPTHNIFCAFNDFEDFWGRVIVLALDKLVKEGKIKPKIAYHSKQEIEETYIVWMGVKEDTGIKLTASELWFRLLQRYGEGEVKEIPKLEVLDGWINRYFKKGKIPEGAKYPGLLHISDYIGKKLGYDKETFKDSMIRRKVSVPLNTVLYLAHYICELDLERIEENITNMYLGFGAKPVAIIILKVLFDSEKALSAEEITKEMKENVSRKYLQTSLKVGRYISSKMFKDGESRFTIRGEEFKFAKVEI